MILWIESNEAEAGVDEEACICITERCAKNMALRRRLHTLLQRHDLSGMSDVAAIDEDVGVCHNHGHRHVVCVTVSSAQNQRE